MDGSTEPDSAIFYYNNKGNPVRISSPTGMYPPDIYFYYDEKDRLTDYFGSFPNDMYFWWYHYNYDNKGRVIADTLNGFGAIIDGKPVPHDEFKWHSVYEYDPFDRIKKVTMTEFTSTGKYIDSFAYNSAGNLVFPRDYQFEAHDNKVSFLRTNKVWMFLSRNYSRNNLARAEAYNSAGLPVRFNSPVIMRLTHSFQVNRTSIEYRCK